MRRRWAIVVVVALTAFIVGALLAHVVLLPHLAARRVVGLARERGLFMDIGRTSIVGMSFRFSDVVVCATDCGPDDPLIVSIDTIKVTPKLRSFVTKRPRASAVSVSGASVRIDLARADSLRSLAGRRGDGRGEDKTGGAQAKMTSPGRWDSLPKVSARDVQLEVLYGENLRVRFESVQVLSDREGDAPSIDLGRTTFTSTGIDMQAQHVFIDLGKGEEDGLVGAVRISNPIVVLHLPAREGPGEPGVEKSTVSDHDPKTGQARDGPSNLLKPLLSMVDEAMALTVLPEPMAGFLPHPRVEFNKGALTIEASGQDALEARALRGFMAIERPGDSLVLDMAGEVDQGPFSIHVMVDAREVEVEADTPYMPAGRVAGMLPVPDLLKLEDARIMAHGTAVLDRLASTIVFDGTLGGDGLTIDSDRLALEPLTSVHFRFDGHIGVDGEDRSLSMSAADLNVTGIPIRIEDARIVRMEKGYVIKMTGNLPRTRCQELFSALPFGMRGSLPGFMFDGELGATFELDMDWNQPDDAVMDVVVDNQCQVVTGGDLKLAKFGHTFTHHVEDKVGEHDFIMGPGSENWVDLEEIAPHMPHALVTCEDGAFYKHKGISASAIKRAVKKNIEKGYFAYGASTITMQLVKNLFLTRDKTISRKLQEMIITWWIENSLEKDRIMELYLNVVEYGPALYGIKNASWHFFAKHPIDLDLLECAFLAKMLPNPVARYRYYEKGRSGLDPEWMAVLARVVGKMLDRGYITKDEHDQALATPFEFYYPDLDLPTKVPFDGDDDVSTTPEPEAGAATLDGKASPFPDFSGAPAD